MAKVPSGKVPVCAALIVSHVVAAGLGAMLLAMPQLQSIHSATQQGVVRVRCEREREREDFARPITPTQIECDKLQPANEKKQIESEDVVYGHVHMAKTGGTTVNGKLALNFERVCGHKGYSFNYYQINAAVDPKKNIEKQPHLKNGLTTSFSDYEDCDYISLEEKWKNWKPISTSFEPHGLPFELHLPCRDPVEHLLSLCNQQHKMFDCHQPIEQEILKCLKFTERFDMGLQAWSLKCFNFANMTGYLEYMAQRLQKKRIQAKYVYRSSNQPRPKKECLKENDDLRKKVEQYLLREDVANGYYHFCSKCLNSSRDLLAPRSTSIR